MMETITTTGTVAEWQEALMQVAEMAFVCGVFAGMALLLLLAQLWGWVQETKWYRSRAARYRRREALRWRMIRRGAE